MKGGRVLGEVEEYFAAQLVAGDTFMFAGQLLEFVEIKDLSIIARKGRGGEPKVPVYGGGRMPLSTFLSEEVRDILSNKDRWRGLPHPVLEWLDLQEQRSELPPRNGVLVETFPRGGRYFLVAYCFEGRNAHQTLGMLLTKRMDRAGMMPLGFVANDYVIAVWSAKPPVGVRDLFSQDMLGDDLEEWMDESSLLRRTFRNVAVISGLIERRHPGLEKTGKQVTFSADLVYDVLRRYEPDHVLLQATRQDAARGLMDVSRLGQMLARANQNLVVQTLDRVSPLSVPIMLEKGRQSVPGTGTDDLLAELEADLLNEAVPELTGFVPPDPAQRALAL